MTEVNLGGMKFASSLSDIAMPITMYGKSTTILLSS